MSVADAHYGLPRRVLSGRGTPGRREVPWVSDPAAALISQYSWIESALSSALSCKANERGRECHYDVHVEWRGAEYANRIDTRIILIDGTELAPPMIAHGAGVTPVAVYESKRVDSDFFAGE